MKAVKAVFMKCGFKYTLFFSCYEELQKYLDELRESKSDVKFLGVLM